MKTVPQASLSQILQQTVNVMARIDGGKSLTYALAQIPENLRPAVQALSFYVLRNGFLSLGVVNILCPKPPVTSVRNLLMIALSLLVAPSLPGRNPIYSEFTIVNEAVKCARKNHQTERFAGLVNACLRRFIREQEVLLARVRKDEVAKYGYPKWWLRILQEHYEQWENIVNQSNLIAPMTIRVNPKKITLSQYQSLLNQQGINSTQVGEQALMLDEGVSVHSLPHFAEGFCSVQDAGAQLAAQLIPWQDGWRVLDACAAPGGKTGHVLEKADLDLVAVDIDQERLNRVQENLQRLQQSAILVAADVVRTKEWWDGKLFDVILIDAPCTGSGVVRRHPDIKWLRRPQDVEQTVKLQQKMVQALWPLLAPNGYFLYMTCSIFACEGEQQAQFISNFAGAKRLEAPGQILPLSINNQPALHDGFFYALFQKTA